MPNVVLVGYTPAVAKALRSRINEILIGLGKADDGITTILKYADTERCDRIEPAPYMIVRDSNANEGEMIANLCAERLNVDVELETIVFKPASIKGPPNLPKEVLKDDDTTSWIDWDQILALEVPKHIRDFFMHLRKNKNLPTAPSDNQGSPYKQIEYMKALFCVHDLKYTFRKAGREAKFYLVPLR